MSKERLVELLLQTETFTADIAEYVRQQAEHKAEYILANGAIVPPLKVGDVVYRIAEDGTIAEERVGAIHLEFTIDNGTGWQDVWWLKDYNIGDTTFLTREEAEKKMKEKEQ